MLRKIGIIAACLTLAVSLTGCPEGTEKKTDGGTPGTETKTGEGGTTEGGTDAAPAASTKPDLAHVKVGQKYTYEMQGGMQQVMEVKEKTDEKVTYTTTTIMNGNPVGEPQTQTFPMAPAAPAGDAPATPPPAPAMKELGRETVDIGGVKLNIRKIETEAGGMKSETWQVVNGADSEVVTFPMYTKILSGGNVTMELKKIE